MGRVSRRIVVFFSWLSLASLASPATVKAGDAGVETAEAAGAETAGAETAEEAVTIASAAFEYRDFEKVIATLGPWLYPLRISDSKLVLRARELLGISLHLEGDIPGARRELQGVLLSDPQHKLDPFVVPPNVIATFEGLRKEMRRVLEQTIRQQGAIQKEQGDEAVGPRSAFVPSVLSVSSPFGLPQFAIDEPALGSIFLGLQVIGLAANIAGFAVADQLRTDDPDFSSWQTVQYVGLTSFLLAWLGSALHGNLSLPSYRAEVLDRDR